MKLANSWLRVEPDGRSITVGVFVTGGWVKQTVYQARNKRPAKWVEVLNRLINGEWISQRDLDMLIGTPHINRFLRQVNENAGTNFQLASRFRPGKTYAEKGLIGG